jgi:hypothetical protein
MSNSVPEDVEQLQRTWLEKYNTIADKWFDAYG